jgi:hypothetical protein
MRSLKKISFIFVFIILGAVQAVASDSSSQRNHGRHNGPPPEAYSACEDKSAGDTSEFVSPRGDTISGTCVEENGQLVLKPENGGKERSGRK